jgi:spoIIIJ-associated protein
MMKQEDIQKNIIGLLAKLGFAEGEITVSLEEKANTLWFSIQSPHTRLFLLRDGEALIALNHIATKITENMTRGDETHPRVVIDANGIEKKKIENLKSTAHMMAERARYFKSSVSLDPMPAHERRIMHEFLGEMPDLKTESEGMGDKRHVVIKYTGGI